MTQVIQLNARDESIANQMVICGQFLHLTDPENFDSTSYLAFPHLHVADLGNDPRGRPIFQLTMDTEFMPATNRPVDILTKRVLALQTIHELLEDNSIGVSPDLSDREWITTIHQAVASIANRTRRGSGNILIINPNHASFSRIATLPLLSNLTIVTTPDISESDIIIGYVGEKVAYDAGVIAVERDVDRQWNIRVHSDAANYYRLLRMGK